MVEDIRLDPRIVRGSEKGIAGTKAGAHDAEALIALRREPVQAAAHVDHGLPCRIERPADVGRDGVVGTIQFRGHAVVVIGKTESQRRYAELADAAAQRLVLVGARIPVRQHDHGALLVRVRGVLRHVVDRRNRLPRLAQPVARDVLL
ncbi:MAG: hypothetical protein MUC42_11050, partial [Bryobacter sp.]|nr:hypothetical protein [Bryobacter sp.]